MKSFMKKLGAALYRRRGQMYFVAVGLIAVFAVLGFVMPEGSTPALRMVLWWIAIAIGFCSVVVIYAGKGLIPEHDTVVVTSPVRGRWLAMNSPASKVPSHGIRMYGQAYAIDLVYEPEGQFRPAFGEGSPMRKPADYPAFGEPVLAMIDGVVVRASDWRRDHRARTSVAAILYMMVEGMVREFGGSGFIIGNHVTIRGENGVFATVAHLQRGSAIPRIGETVRAGQQIGRCGNSGNSSEPHVHAQLMDRESPWTAQGISMAFRNIVVGDGAAGDGMPRNGEHLIADTFVDISASEVPASL